MDHYLGGVHAVTAVLRRFPNHVKMLFYIKKLPKEVAVAVEEAAVLSSQAIRAVDQVFFDQHLPGVHAQGVAALVQQLPTVGLDYVLQLTSMSKKPLVLALDRIQDPHNLGACIRSAAAFAVDAVIISRHQSVGLTPTAIKVASGGACVVPVIVVSNLSQSFSKLKKAGYWLYATSEHATDSIDHADLSVPVVWVMGSEGRGVAPGLMKTCDAHYKIAVGETFSTLNVSVATGICLYQTQRLRAGSHSA